MNADEKEENMNKKEKYEEAKWKTNNKVKSALSLSLGFDILLCKKTRIHEWLGD